MLRGYFPLLMPTSPAGLSKVSNSYDKFRQTGEGGSGKGRLLGRKFRLKSSAVALVDHSVFRDMSWIL